MPIFEYKCNDCDTKFEILHKSSNNLDDVVCPACKSNNAKKLLSSFNASVNNSSSPCHHNHCASGGCELAGGCPSGMCGLA